MSAKIRGNGPCPCGSGRKFKKCCGNAYNRGRRQSRRRTLPPEIIDLLRQKHEAHELIRKQQQGLGRPMISAQLGDHRMVVVGDKIHTMTGVKFPADFWSKYVKTVMGGEWGKAQLAKQLEERHPIMQWYDAYCHYQRKQTPDEDGNYNSPMTAVVACYLGLGYDLYLLAHNVELQARLVARLKDERQFQGAYYELIVANCLIRAGFDLVLEDEADGDAKHCEFSAVSKKTGKKYWVEAKMRAVAGVLGKSSTDGMPRTSKPSSQLSTHLRLAFQKPAADERLIFVDVNAPPEPIMATAEPSAAGMPEEPMPVWMKAAFKQLDDREKNPRPAEKAYLFVTNYPYHWNLETDVLQVAAMGYGLGIPDFGRGGVRRLPEIWKNKQRHIDGHNILQALQTYPNLPATFDGSLPLPRADAEKHVMVGEAYTFVNDDGVEVTGTVTSASVLEADKKVFIGVSTIDGKNQLLIRGMSDTELAAYKAHPDAFFGVVQPVPKKLKTPAEMFEWLVGCYKDATREQLLAQCKNHPDVEKLKTMDQEELLLAVCERLACAVIPKEQMVEIVDVTAPGKR